jgi:hypothetical protein
LVGYNDGRFGGSITNCYSIGSVSGSSVVGGLVGITDGRFGGSITNCYSAGSVSGGQYLGGLVGYNWEGVVNYSFWDIDTSGQSTSAAGTGKTTAEMQTASTFSAWVSCESTVWTIDDGADYPRLVWENAPGALLHPFSGGSGTEADPYLIDTAEQLNTVGLMLCLWDRHFKLMANIDLSTFTGTSFNIIGTNLDNPFTGVFDGNDHAIFNFTYDSNDRNYIGLFGYVNDPNAEIKNLGLIDPNVNAGTGDDVGSLVGYLREGTISNCYAEGGSVAGDAFVGGLVGWNYYFTTIRDCYTTVAVDADSRVGGLVGINHVGTITNCRASGPISGADMVGGLVGLNFGTISDSYATGVVVASDKSAGGLVGFNNGGVVTSSLATGTVSGSNQVGGLAGGSSGTIRDSYATGVVDGNTIVGGLVGSAGGTIANCYSNGSVIGTSDVGGLLGSSSGAAVSSYWDMDTSGQTSSAAGIGKTTAQMQTAATYVSWGCGGVWTIVEGVDYPHLVWENLPGILLTDLPVYAGGSGEPNDPYLIATAEQLNAIGQTTCHWDKHFVLTADIDLSVYTGTEYNIIANFTGAFDGNDYTISNFTYDSNDRDYIGLFGYLSGGEIKNLGLIDPNVDAGTGNYVGSLVGRLEGGNISSCYVEGGSSTGNNYVGGLVGRNSIFLSAGKISNCYSTASVFGNERVGGLAGYNRSTITNSYSAGSVTGDSYIGGLVGANSGTIANCYATGNVTGTENTGGLLGSNHGTIGNSYATGAVSGTSDFGGLVGRNYGVVIVSFWDIETSGQSTSDGGTGKTTAQMQTASTYISWGCVGVWTIDEGVDYPHLVWENLPGILLIDLPVYAGGSGEPNDPYLIATAEQLNTIGVTYCHLDKHFVLTADIDLSVYTGTQFNIISGFTGVFNGNGHTISNFTYDSNDINRIGLFGYVNDPNSEIRNLGLIDPNVNAGTGNNVGSLVGSLTDGTITNCYADGANVAAQRIVPYSSTAENVGGLVGFSDNGTVTDCYSEGVNVMGPENVGGLVGSNEGTISECFSTGSVSGGIDGDSLGGLCGRSQDGIISESYSKGSVTGGTGSFYVGGLCGFNWRSVISNSSSESTVSGRQYIGGLCGRNNNYSTISNCYATGSVSSTRSQLGGLVGGNERSTVTYCYATGSVTGTASSVGGLVGSHWGYGTINECFSTGFVSSSGSSVGGLVGKVGYGILANCFWDTETSGQSIGYNNDPTNPGTVTNVLGKTTTEMMQQATFTDWDFVVETSKGTEDIWSICEGVDYPKLTWQFIIGDFDGDSDVDFGDYALLVARWRGTDNSFWCAGGGTDITNDGMVTFDDLRYFANGWLSGI